MPKHNAAHKTAAPHLAAPGQHAKPKKEQSKLATYKADLKAKFTALDKSGDGLLSFNEFHVLLLQGNPDMTKREVFGLYKAIDKDSDGKIDFHEFVDYLFPEGLPVQQAASKAPKQSPAPSSAGSTDPSPRPSPRAPVDPANIDYSDLKVGAGCRIEKTEMRAITTKQLKALWKHVKRRCKSEGWENRLPQSKAFGHQLTMATIDLYNVVDWVVKPATMALRVSYIEFVADSNQRPLWFVSHWWGERHGDFIMCLEQHGKDRALSEDTSYWVCAYANNQWELSGDVASDPAKSSFSRAIGLSIGTISVLDREATCYSRIWCSFEVFYTLVRYGEDLPDEVDGSTPSDHLYDVYTCTGRRAVGLTDGTVSVDFNNGEEAAPYWKSQRESTFPAKLAYRALAMELSEAEASVDSDRRHILNSIAGVKDLEAEPLKHHERYGEVDQVLRGRFASGMWRQAAESGHDMSDFKQSLADSRADKMCLSLNGCQETVSSKQFETLTGSLPQTLQDLDLDFTNCRQLDDAAINALASRLQQIPKLKRLQLRFADCPQLTDANFEVLAGGLPSLALSNVLLDFQGCEQLDEEAAQKLGVAVSKMKGLKSLNLDMYGCRKVTGDAGETLAKSIPYEKLEDLEIRFSRCAAIADGTLMALAEGLKKSSRLRRLVARFEGCRLLTPDGAFALVESLQDGALHNLDLTFRNCPNIQVAEVEGKARRKVKAGGSGSVHVY